MSSSRTILLLCPLLLIANASGAVEPEHREQDRGTAVRARAIVRGAPGSGIEGVVTFKQPGCPGCPTPGLSAPAQSADFQDFPEPTVAVRAKIRGPVSALTPGAHGVHIHETGRCDPPAFTTANGHFDAGPFGHSTPVDANHPFHTGDLPNLMVDENGVGFLKHRTSRITLSPGPLSVFDADGSAVIVHLNPDRGINGVAGASGGPRIACGIIEMVTDDGEGEE
jgi:Cu-Zn family superoxide dismutase